MPYCLLAAVVGVLVSLATMRWLPRHIRSHTFRPFGVYRILVGAVVVALVLLGRL